MDAQPRATIASMIVGAYRGSDLKLLQDPGTFEAMLDNIERDLGRVLDEASAGNEKLLGTMGELAKRAAAAESLAQHYGEQYRDANQNIGKLAESELRAHRDAEKAREALTELKGKHAVLSAERMRLVGYLDAIDPMVDVPQPPVQMTRRRYVLNSGPRPTPADMYATQSSRSSKPWWDL